MASPWLWPYMVAVGCETLPTNNYYGTVNDNGDKKYKN
jgi:hypothetical protein